AHCTFGKPDVSVGPACNAVRPGTTGDRKFRDVASWGNARDLIRRAFAKPKISVGPRNNPNRSTVWGGGVEFGETAVITIEATDLGGAAFAKPKMIIRPDNNDVGLAVHTRDGMQHNVDRRSVGTRCLSASSVVHNLSCSCSPSNAAASY